MSPKEEVELLMNHGMEFAVEMLRKYGEFFPFARAMDPGGGILVLEAYDGREQPPSAELAELLEAGLRKGVERGDYGAVAIFLDVRVGSLDSPERRDAVQVGLEHRDDYRANVYLPYTLVNDEVEFGETFAHEREATIFL